MLPFPEVTLSDSQARTLTAILDAVFQGYEDGSPQAQDILAHIPPEATDLQRAQARKMVSMSFSDIPDGIDYALRTVKNALSPAAQAEMLQALSVLSSGFGTALLSGRASLLPFEQLPVKMREEILISWADSPFESRRKLYKGFTSIGLLTAYVHSDVACEAVGYPSSGDPNRFLSRPPPATPRHEHVFAAPSPQVTTDFLVIGSGSGGGVAAAEFSKTGQKVLVVEQGTFFPLGELEGTQAAGLNKLFLNGGCQTSEDGSISVLAGATFGGGSFINWSASLRPPQTLRERWAKTGLPHFTSAQFDKSVETVCARMGVSDTALTHSKGNQIFIETCKRLGQDIHVVPQNTNGQNHACGLCSFGCPYGEKQGTTETFLVDAARNGAEFLQSAQVVRLLFTEASAPSIPTLQNLASFTYTASRTRCIGALIEYIDGSQSVIFAKTAVCVSGGSICSPAILLRSGLINPNIGKNLKLHPCTFINGFFDEEIKPWEGAILTSLSNVAKADGTFANVKLEVQMSWPGGMASLTEGWRGAAQHKADMLNFNHSFSLITLVSDQDGGRIVLDANGQHRIEYTISKRDAASALEGLLAGCKVMRVANARKISTPQAGVEPWVRRDDETDETRFQEFLKRVKKAGVHPNWTGLASAHQMGTNAMGTNPRKSVVDPRGRVWGTDNLYVADASIFPSSSGVNPMITTMSCAHAISNFVIEDVAAVSSSASQKAVGGRSKL